VTSALIPPRRLVALYLATAHISLALAFLLTAWNPLAVAGFFYHARIVAIVHLVTIGWIAMSILGSVYIVLPLACGTALPARRGDYVAYSLVVIGLIGMVAHFWIGEFGGMAWSAATTALGILHVVVRAAVAMRRAKVADGVKLHVYFAAINLAGAVTMGVLLGFDKAYPFLPGYVLSNVFAHAHLAALGWVCMTMMGLAYRLLPMILPAAMPSRRRVSLSAILLEAGIAGLFVSLVTRSGATPLFALTIVASFMAFGVQLLWMLARPKRPPHHRTADFAVHHLGAAGVYLVLACVSGVMLAALPMSETTMRVALLYGVLGLLGFLAQAIVGFERRILPMASAYWALEQSDGAPSPQPRPPAAPLWIFLAWLGGVPLVALGFFLDSPVMLASGSWALFAGVLLMLRDLTRTFLPRRATARRSAAAQAT
jgi:hypothetical protein